MNKELRIGNWKTRPDFVVKIGNSVHSTAGFTLTKVIGQGFTLIEILVASAILVILGSGFLGLQYVVSENQTSAWTNYMAIENANMAINAISKELRNAGESHNGGYPLITLNNQEIIFYSDYDFDGKTERIRYTLSGTQLSKGVIEPVGDPAVYDTGTEKVKVITDIIRNGASDVFTYYNSEWPADTTNNPLPAANRIADTRFVKIYLVANYKANNPDADFILESDVRIRMLQSE